MDNSTAHAQEYLDWDVVPYDNPQEMTIPWVINPHFVPTILVYSLCFVLGTVGNALVIWAMQCGRNKTVTGMFLVSLAVADMLLLFFIPADVASYFIKTNQGGNVSCKMVGYSRKLSAFATVLNLMAITVERYVVIVHPMRARQYVTMRNCQLTLVLVWTLAILMALPSIYTWEIQPFFYGKFINETLIRATVVKVLICEEASVEGGYIIFYYLILLFILPLALHSVCYTKMIYVLWSSTSLTTHTGVGAKKSSQGDVHLIVTPEPDDSCASELLSVSADATAEQLPKDNTAATHHSFSPANPNQLAAKKLAPNYELIDASSGVSNGGIAQQQQHPRFRRSRAESLAYTECPTLMQRRSSRSQRAMNIILNWRQRHKKESSPPITINGHKLSVVPSTNKHLDLKAGRRQVIKMLLVVTLAFMVCWGPLVLFDAMSFYEVLPYYSSTFVAKLLINLLPYVHCTLNPIIYGFMSKNFRMSLRKACGPSCSKPSAEMSSGDHHRPETSTHFSMPPSPRATRSISRHAIYV